MDREKFNTFLYFFMILLLVIVGSYYVLGTRVGKYNRVYIIYETCGDITKTQITNEHAFNQRIEQFNEKQLTLQTMKDSEQTEFGLKIEG